jgi:hypothetical protein
LEFGELVVEHISLRGECADEFVVHYI